MSNTAIIYGMLVSNVICYHEAVVRSQRLGLAQDQVYPKYGSLHFIVNFVQTNNKIYKIAKFNQEELKRSSELKNTEIKEHRLVLEASYSLEKTGAFKEKHSHVSNLEMRQLYALTVNEFYIKKNHTTECTRSNRGGHTILTYFIKSWADCIKMEKMTEEDNTFLSQSSQNDILSPPSAMLELLPSLRTVQTIPTVDILDSVIPVVSVVSTNLA